ncbi:fatty acid hydroxylase domain-containing protein 2-like [Chironomus tepperi]|uniref:fatty acid hydroxylase domain-containing protein 2-like n=1 Tax=Chironomus tepperi TaxID=113505 RepID=UPI00391F351F
MFSLFDFMQKPAFIRKYKVNPHTNEPPDFMKFVKVVTFSSSIGLALLVPTCIATYYGLKWRGIQDIHALPNVQTVLISCFINDHIVDIGTYISHRTLHHKRLYKHFHKIHHEYKSTIAVSVLYSHPIEHIFAHLIPIALSIIIMRCHFATAWISVMSFLISSTINHSGYHLPFLNSPEFHDFHHMKFDSNYSGFGLMDWIFGTDKAYKNSVYQKRDRLLLSLKSAHELYSEEKSEKIQ